MKKIAIIDYDLSVIGGVEQVTNTLANELSNHFEVYVISLNSKMDNCPYKFNNSVKFIEILHLKEYRMRDIILRSRKQLRKILIKNNIDVVLEMGTYAGFITTLNSFGIKSKFVFCDHGALINQLNERKVTFMRKFISKFCNKIVVLTDRNKNDYKRMLRIKANKLIRIYNWIDEKVFNYVEPYSERSNLIISVGRMTNEKGFDMLVEVAKLLKEQNDNWKWHIYGDGPNYDSVKKSIEKYALSENVILKGQTLNMYELYKDYSLLVLPSYREGLPLVLLEAKANHLPIVSFDIITGPREIVTDSVDGFLISPYNISEMAKKINELLKTHELRKKFANNTYLNIDKFRKDTILKEWIDLIQNV